MRKIKILSAVLVALFFMLACSVFTGSQQSGPMPIYPRSAEYPVTINLFKDLDGEYTIQVEIKGRRDLIKETLVEYEYFEPDAYLLSNCYVGNEFSISCTTSDTVTAITVEITGVDGYDYSVMTVEVPDRDSYYYYGYGKLKINLYPALPESIY